MDDMEKYIVTALIALAAVSVASRVPAIGRFVFNVPAPAAK